MYLCVLSVSVLKTKMNRRKFISTIVRGTILTGITAMSGYLLLREVKSETCDFDFICKNCRKLENCKLPEANNYKKTESNKEDCFVPRNDEHSITIIAKEERLNQSLNLLQKNSSV